MRAGPGAAAALAIVVAVVLQAAVLSRLPLPGGPPNLVLVLVVAIGLAAGGSAGLAAGFGAGLLTDLLSDHPVGVLALCFALAGFLAGLLEADVRRSVLLPVVVVAVATGAVYLAYLGVMGLLGRTGRRRRRRCVRHDRVRRRAHAVRRPAGRWRSPGGSPRRGEGCEREAGTVTSVRLAVIRIVVVSLLLTLGARLYYLQVLDQDKLVQTANRQHTREVILAAPRGAIVDDRGRPLVTNRSTLVVSVEPVRAAGAGRRRQGRAQAARPRCCTSPRPSWPSGSRRARRACRARAGTARRTSRCRWSPTPRRRSC